MLVIKGERITSSSCLDTNLIALYIVYKNKLDMLLMRCNYLLEHLRIFLLYAGRANICIFSNNMFLLKFPLFLLLYRKSILSKQQYVISILLSVMNRKLSNTSKCFCMYNPVKVYKDLYLYRVRM